MPAVNATHDPGLKSWVDSANRPESDFPIQNLPYGVFTTLADPAPRVGVAIGDQIVDLAVLEAAGLLGTTGDATVFGRPSLNAFMRRGPRTWTTMRARLSELLRRDNAQLRDDAALRARALVPLSEGRLQMPFEVSGYTDFYASKEHASNVGSMFRDPANALLPNWLYIPIGYNGRASTVVVSGTPVRRPLGQIKLPESARPIFAACRKLDFELEMAAILGQDSTMGEPLTTDRAEAMIFGFVLLNDWSARDIQQWEYLPLGPFQSKAFATSISPWVVTKEALEPFRVEGPAQEPPPLAYLRQSGPQNYDIRLETALRPAGAAASTAISRTSFRHMYWSSVQQLVHHAAGGCAMRVGDLLASGTISGPTPDSYGSLLEITWNGTRPLTLGGGAERRFLEDGDEVVMTGWCEGEGYRVGFGSVSGVILPSRPADN